MARGFVYRGDKRTAEDINRKKSEGSRDYDSYIAGGIKTFKPKEGENCVRILPSTWDEPDWDYVITLHYDIGPDGARYLCPDKMLSKPCPICDARAETSEEEEQDKLNPSKGAICWVIDRDNEKEGPELWTIPFTKVRNEIYARSVDKKTREPILVDHPEEGYDIVFNRSGTGTKTQYTGVEVVRDPSPIHENEKTQQKWLEYIGDHPLPDCLNFYDAEHMKKVLYGRASAKGSGEEAAEDAPQPRSRRALATEDSSDEVSTPSRRRPAQAPEEESPADTPGSDRAARRRALLSEDNDPPFDPDTGEVQDEDAPAPRSSRRAASEEPVEEETPTASARRSLERLKPSARR